MNIRYILILIFAGMLAACQENPTPEIAPPDEPAPTMTSTVTPVKLPVTIPEKALPTQTPTPTVETEEPISSSVFLPFLTTESKIYISQIQMYANGSGWALGGSADKPETAFHVLVTQDHAISWSDRTPPEPAPAPGSPDKYAVAYFLDPLNAWVTFAPPDPSQKYMQPVIWRTSNGGLSWEASQVLPGAARSDVYSPTQFFFADLRHGWLMSHHGAAAGHTPVSIHRTTDGGLTWEIVAQPMDELSFSLHTCCQREMIFFEDLLTGLVARDAGPNPFPHVIRTTDGGFTWEQRELPQPEADFFQRYYCGTHSLQWISQQTASVVMDCAEMIPEGEHRSFLYTTYDMSNTWTWEPLPEPEWPLEWQNTSSTSEIQWLTPTTGWLFVFAYYELPNSTTGNNATQIYQTSDGGISWTPQGLTFWGGQFSFINPSTGFAVARANQQLALVSTKNSGLNWEIIEPQLIK